MGKIYVTMVDTITFEVDDVFKDSDGDFKKAIENGDIKISEHNVILVNQDGKIHDNQIDMQIIKRAIVYGLTQRG